MNIIDLIDGVLIGVITLVVFGIIMVVAYVLILSLINFIINMIPDKSIRKRNRWRKKLGMPRLNSKK